MRPHPRAAVGSRSDPRVTVKKGNAQTQVRFNAALSNQYGLERFTHVLITPSPSRIEFRFSTMQMVDGAKAYALQGDGGSSRSSARVTYVSARRFPEFVVGEYEVEGIGARPLKLAISTGSMERASIQPPKSNPHAIRESLSLGSEEPLRSIIARIRDRWQPIQIWCFGSRARGDANATSDWDLLAVVPDETPSIVVDDPLSTWDLRSIAGQRTDITLCRRSDFADFRDVPNTLAYEVSHTGRLVG